MAYRVVSRKILGRGERHSDGLLSLWCRSGTNNPVEQVIRHFNQRYKVMCGFKSLETARRHARLFQIVYRFSPFTDDVEDKSKRGIAPLQRAGYQIDHMPIYQYLTAPLLFNVEPARNLALLKDSVA